VEVAETICTSINGDMWGQQCVPFDPDGIANSASTLRLGCSNHNTAGTVAAGNNAAYPLTGELAGATYFNQAMSMTDQAQLAGIMRANSGVTQCTGCAIVSDTHSTSDTGRYGHFSTACMERTLGAVSGSEQGKQLWVIRNGVQYRTGYAQVWPTPNHATLYSADGWGHMRWGADSYPTQTFPDAAGDWQIGDIFVGSAVDAGSCLY
jgi:hypothetical protein